MWHKHRWSEWEEDGHNNQVWVHDKRIYRYCSKCGKAENKVIKIDCTQFRRTGRYCESCLEIINENRGLAGVGILVYNEENLKLLSMPGRKPNYKAIKRTHELRALGYSFRKIALLEKCNVKTVFMRAKYPLDKAKKRTYVG